MRASLAGIVLVVLAAGFVLLYLLPQGEVSVPATGGAPAGTRPAGGGGPGAGTAPAGDWPMCRGGPELTGVAGGRLDCPLVRRWRFKTGGAVRSSAAVVAGRVFVGSDDGKVHALALRDGGKLWEFKTGAAVEASPCVLDGRVYVGSLDAHLYCLDAATGRREWKYKTGGEIHASAGYLRLRRQGRTAILVCSFDASLHAVDAATGRKMWTYPTEERLYGAPAVGEGNVVFGGRDGVLRVVSAAGKKVREVDVGICIPGAVALAGGRGYLAHYGNRLVCMDLSAGRIVWEYEKEDAPFFSSPAVHADRVLIGGRDGRMHCVGGEDGKGLWTFGANEDIDSSPVVCDGKVVFGSNDGRLYVVALEDGKELFSYDIGQAVSASAAVDGGVVVIGGEDGYVYAFGGGRARPSTRKSD